MKSREERLLEQLVVNNAELDELEALLAEFNIFEAIGAVRQELRHSDYLAFLLNPSKPHGLGDAFLKLFLKTVLVAYDRQDLSPIEIDVADLGHIEVNREWSSIDILLKDSRNRWIIAIENKVDAGEGQGQLKKYADLVEREFPNFRHVFIFLTPERRDPTDGRWEPADYDTVLSVIEAMLDARRSTMGADVATLMSHYAQMLRRHIVSDSRVVDLCQTIYARHKEALDLIFEHRPDLQLEISQTLQELVKGESPADLDLDYCSKSYVRFAPKAWDACSLQLSGKGWTRSKRVLLFEFQNSENSLTLKLIIGPGDPDFRRALFEHSAENRTLFNGGMPTLTSTWTQIYKKIFLTKGDLQKDDREALFNKLTATWRHFVEHDYAGLRQSLGALLESLRDASQ